MNGTNFVDQRTAEQADGTQAEGSEPAWQKLRSHKLLRPADLDRLCETEKQPYLVDGLLRQNAIALWVGDSGIGKSALAYQLGICVAAGKEFLGRPVVRGRVVYIDFENSLLDSQVLRNALSEYLGLAEAPEDFLTRFDGESFGLASLLEEVQPALLIIDSLRAYRPGVEEKPKEAAGFLNELRRLARKYRVTIVLIHHVRQEDRKDGRPYLDHSPAMDWLTEASGVRALLNHVDVRLGIDDRVGLHKPFTLGRAGGGTLDEQMALVLKGHERLKGEFGPLYLARVFGEDGEPCAYRLLVSLELLSEDQRKAYEALPAKFTFSEAQRVYGRTADPTNKFLKKCQSTGLLRKLAKGQYEKIEPPPEPVEQIE
jgi:AAA domain